MSLLFNLLKWAAIVLLPDRTFYWWSHCELYIYLTEHSLDDLTVNCLYIYLAEYSIDDLIYMTEHFIDEFTVNCIFIWPNIFIAKLTVNCVITWENILLLSPLSIVIQLSLLIWRHLQVVCKCCLSFLQITEKLDTWWVGFVLQTSSMYNTLSKP